VREYSLSSSKCLVIEPATRTQNAIKIRQSLVLLSHFSKVEVSRPARVYRELSLFVHKGILVVDWHRWDSKVEMVKAISIGVLHHFLLLLPKQHEFLGFTADAAERSSSFFAGPWLRPDFTFFTLRGAAILMRHFFAILILFILLITFPTA